MKKTYLRLIILSLISTFTFSHAVLPPKYLEITDFKQCLATEQSEQTYTAWCMPSKKVKHCPSKSWKKLRALRGKDTVPPCSEKMSK
jgi:hypothetical protein